MGQKHVVVQGAQCMCNYGTAPDSLKVLSNKREYVNDFEGATKAVASTKDIGSTLERNSFGSCALQKNNPCVAQITAWSAYSDRVLLSSKGNILLEDSKATCPIGGQDCIRIVQHGQKAALSSANIDNVHADVQLQLNPLALEQHR